MSRPTAVVMHPDCGRHDTGWRHPEHQGRLPGVVRALYRQTPALLDRVLQREGTPAGDRELLRVHTAEHLERLRAAAAEAERGGKPVHLDPDTRVSAASWDAARAASGCAITAASLVMAGEAATAFAITRPPGHHATADRAMGFCLVNHVAVAARWLQAERGVRRILIVDWDVHHGNGTQDIFYEDADVYFLSLHLSPHYPGTGAAGETGAGAGVGTTRNVPLEAGTPPATYLQRFDEALDMALAAFTPEFVLVSCGLDVLRGDPLGGLALEPVDVHAMTRRLAARADAAAGSRITAVLEGGYLPDRLGEGVVAVVRALAGLDHED